MNYFFADFGSSFIKYAVYDKLSDKITATEKLPFPSPCISNKISFIVPEKEIALLVKRLINIAEGFGCKRMFISVQMHGYLVKYQNNKFSDYISWRDKSGNTDYVKEYNIDFSLRGTLLKNNLPFVKMCANKDALFGAEFFTLGSYISYLLTGNNITHKTDGCASGLFNAETLLPEIHPIDNLKTPEILDKVTAIGKYNDLEIYTPCGDHQVTFQGINEDDFCLINIGTATQISCLGNGCFNDSHIEN